jgi:pyridoxal phosphate enzyme (YggS family)
MSSSAADAAVDEIDVAEHLRQVRAALAAAQLESPDPTTNVRLVAVSKTKPLALLVKAYEEGDCRIFGENYVQELAEKVPAMPADAHWHFIGSLQSNKVNLLLQAFVPDDVHRLTLETVATAKLARKLNQAVLAQAVPGAQLCVFVQVNTSGEDSKSGVTPGDDVTELCRVIRDDCPALQLQGLMTIGAAGDEACLQALVDCRTAVAAALELPLASELELSMGMSGDYEAAIRYGATNVRVGSTIFGARNYANT